MRALLQGSGEPFDSGVQMLDMVLGFRLHQDTAQDPGAVRVGGDLRVPDGEILTAGPEGAQEHRVTALAAPAD